MKKLFTTAIAICFVSFLFAGSELPVIQNHSLIFSKDLQFAKSLSLNFLEHRVTKKKGRGSDAFEEGVAVISVGYGFGNFTQALFKAWKDDLNYSYKSFGPIHAKFEYGLGDKFGIGASINYMSAGAEWTSTYATTDTAGNTIYVPYNEGFDYSTLSVLCRMNIHFATSDKLDPYWGMGVGYRSGSWKYHSTYPGATEPSVSSIFPFGWETTIGMRYYFTDNIGMYLEMGLAKSMIQAGLSAKF
jgi:opacity protein-like surface antigen